MPRFKNYVPQGVIPATLLAFDDDFSIDEKETRRHLSFVAATRGISAITINGHASEVHACSFEEQERLLADCGRGDRRQAAADRRHLCRWQPRGGEARENASARRRLGAAVLSAELARHGRRAEAPRDGLRAFQDDRGGDRPAADRVSICQRTRLRSRYAGEAHRDHSADQGGEGLVAGAASRAQHPRAAKPAAAGQSAHHQFGLADVVACRWAPMDCCRARAR